MAVGGTSPMWGAERHTAIAHAAAIAAGKTEDEATAIAAAANLPDIEDFFLDHLFRHAWINGWGAAPTTAQYFLNLFVQNGNADDLGRMTHFIADLSMPFHTTWQHQDWHLGYEALTEGKPYNLDDVEPIPAPGAKAAAEAMAREANAEVENVFQALQANDTATLDIITEKLQRRAVGYIAYQIAHPTKYDALLASVVPLAVVVGAALAGGVYWARRRKN